MFYGQLAMLPFWSARSSRSFANLFYSILGELPVCAFAFVLVEKRVFGRKNLLVIFSLFEALTAGCCYFFFDVPGLLFHLLALNRFFMKGIFSVLYVYTSEAFPTNIRVFAYGLANCVGKSSSILMPFVVFSLYEISPNLPISSFAVCGLLSFGAAWLLPFDTYKRELDVDRSRGLDDERMIELADSDSFYTEKYLSMNNNSFEVRYSGQFSQTLIKK